ncbi:MAG: hypothetical protein CMK59_11230 [Proteobacteria bacterium]|nr:hypothetical protein [Pseudomonadota bacterium]
MFPFIFGFLSCEETQPSVEPHVHSSEEDFQALVSELESLKAQIADLESTLQELEEQSQNIPPTDPVDPSQDYTDDDALEAIQNDDPWNNPEDANIQNLWSSTGYGYQFLENSRWTMDNRSDPAGTLPRHELIQMFHETPMCTDQSTFADCNGTAGLKIYANGPQIVDHDWSDAGYAAAAIRTHHTHASGIYVVSFGQASTVSDYPYELIPPSGIHLEPHGEHQALRIDGTNNSGENIRIDTTLGSKGLTIYESPQTSIHCDALGLECETSYPLYLRGGTLHLEDLLVERSSTDSRNSGPATLHDTSLGIEHFYSWYIDENVIPIHCTWNSTVSDDSIIKIQPYSTSPELQVSHSYAIVDVWGPGNAPANCTVAQNIKTDAAGVYGYNFPSNYLTEGGFSVAILGPDQDPLDPGIWGEQDRPAFLYEVIDPL